MIHLFFAEALTLKLIMIVILKLIIILTLILMQILLQILAHTMMLALIHLFLNGYYTDRDTWADTYSHIDTKLILILILN